MPYLPPRGWLEIRSDLERKNVFHEDADCPQVVVVDTPLLPVERPGRSEQCPHCVRHTAAAILAS